ncbi:MAG TPA: LamG-like jellyroll fold domain-containing protein, partial [Streptosporangiaceae bacterium]
KQAGSGGTVEFGEGTGPGTDQASAPVFTPATVTDGKYLEARLATPVGGGTGITLEGWFRAANTLIFARELGALRNDVGSSMGFSLDATGHIQAIGRRGGVLAYAITWPSALASDALTHHAAVVESIAAGRITVRLFLDGVERVSTTFPASVVPLYRWFDVGGRPKHPDQLGMFNGTLAVWAAHAAPLSASRISAHYHAGTDGFAGERTDQRAGRIADWLGLPAADRAFDVGNSTVAAQATAGKQPIEALREVERTEAGVLFMDTSARLVLHNRARRYNQTPAVEIPVSALVGAPVLPADDQFVTNDMTVTRPGGAGAQAVNQASADEIGTYRDSKEIISETDTAAAGVAQWRVGNYGEPGVRIPNVTVDIAKLERVAPSLVPGVLAADISTKLRITGLPAQSPASTVDLFVEGLTEQIGTRSWRITFNTSPAGHYQVWALSVAGFSELGVTTRLAL